MSGMQRNGALAYRLLRIRFAIGQLRYWGVLNAVGAVVVYLFYGFNILWARRIPLPGGDIVLTEGVDLYVAAGVWLSIPILICAAVAFAALINREGDQRIERRLRRNLQLDRAVRDRDV